MSLSAGAKLGPYEIAAPIGAGGMGEVYRARDPRLGREVAIKVLPTAFSADPDRLHRFELEARAAAALNHPNILAVFDIGQHDGSPYIVSELLMGETLRERLAGGPLATRKAVDFGVQAAHSLAAAHEKGIFHRDLKPENLFVTTDGRVKILDFGLAKLVERESAAPAAVAGAALATPVSMLPTSAPHTNPGLVLGTVGYMAPEQVRGLTIDHRADVFAFGAVLYEMLSGQRAFQGPTDADTMTAILREDPPDLPTVERHIPQALERIVDRCLQKNPAARFQTASDLAFALEALSSESGASVVLPASAGRPRRDRWVLVGAVAIALGVSAIAATRYFRRSVVEAPEMRLQVVTPPTDDLLSVAISPDARNLAFVAIVGGKGQLWVRAINSTTPQPLAGTDGASYPFWSPDSRSIGFFSDGKLKRIDAAGGPAQILAIAPVGRGGTWSQDGVILFAGNAASPLSRVPASGGLPVDVTRVDPPRQISHRFPQFLPDGRHFLYSAQGDTTNRGVYIAALDAPQGQRLVEADASAVYMPPGFVLFVRQGTLAAQRIDLAKPALVGEPLRIAEQVAVDTTTNVAGVSAATTGTFAYRVGAGPTGLRQLVWVDRSGKMLGAVGNPDPSSPWNVELSPDGTRVAFDRIVDGNLDVWLRETARDVETRFTFDASRDAVPVWSPDGRALVFSSNRTGVNDLYRKQANGAGAEQQLLTSVQQKAAQDWSPDGRFLLYRSTDPKRGRDLWALPLDGKAPPVVVRQTDFEERDGQFAPDGRWVAYASNESGQFQIYVQPFPGPGGTWQVSTAGGVQPRWNHNSKELFYIALDGQLMSASMTVAPDGQALQPGRPVSLFATRLAGGTTPGINKHQYAVAADGQRFLINRTVEEAAAPPITVVLNWRK